MKVWVTRDSNTWNGNKKTAFLIWPGRKPFIDKEYLKDGRTVWTDPIPERASDIAISVCYEYGTKLFSNLKPGEIMRCNISYQVLE